MKSLISEQKGSIKYTAGFLLFVALVFMAFVVLLNVDSCVLVGNCSEDEHSYDTARIYFETESDRIPLSVELAVDFEERTTGLMFRDYIDPNWGMLFIMPSEATQTFWMKNVKIPLDMIFVDKEKKVVDIKKSVPICEEGTDCAFYTSDKKALYVVEVNSGWSDQNKISLGDLMIFNPE